MIAVVSNQDVLLDEADAPLLECFPWYVNSQGYVAANVRSSDGWKHFKLHRLITDARPGDIVDHANGIRLDNRHANLRLVTPRQNSANAGKAAGKSSPYKGVTRHPCGRWQVSIEARYVGLFVDEIEAAKAYDEAARERFGEFARLNFPVGGGL
jgi:hypothetical protein